MSVAESPEPRPGAAAGVKRDPVRLQVSLPAAGSRPAGAAVVPPAGNRPLRAGSAAVAPGSPQRSGLRRP